MDSARSGTIPELAPDAFLRWRESGAETVDLLAQARRLGPVSAFRIGERPVVLATGPQAVQEVLARCPERYVKRSHRARVLLGDGLLAAAGEQWRRQRRVLQPHFTGRAVHHYEQLMHDCAEETARRWAATAARKTPRRLDADLQHYSLDVIWRAATGRPLDDATHRALRVASDVLAALPALAPANSPQPDLTAQVDEVDAIVEPLIAAARTDPAPGLLRVLFDSADQQPLYTDRLIRDELVTLLTAGYETTATTLGWLFLLLHQHPEQRTWALAAGPAGSPARTEAIRALVSETLRLYPTAWLLPRYAAEDGTLGGHRVLAGTTILICPYLTHRDPDIWPEPDRFLPQRFLDPHRRTPPGAYYPFGIGPRACLGAQFAVREITILLERLLPAFTAAFPDIPGQRFGVTIQPDRELTATITTTT